MQIVVVEEIDSTSLEVRRQIAQGVSLPILVLAGSQTKGRGRTGREWSSPEGNIYLSFAVGVSEIAESLELIPIHVATIIAAWIEDELRLRVTIKWPNDLLISGRKLGGILCEGITDGQGLSHVIVGAGINVKSPPRLTSRSTTNLEYYRPYLKDSVCTKLGRSLGKKIIEAMSSRLSLEQLKRYSIEIGQLWSDGTHFGRMLPISNSGELRLQLLSDNSVKEINHTHHSFSWVYQDDRNDTWVADCGNSFLKIACYHRGQIRNIWSISYSEDQKPRCETEIRELIPFLGWPIHVGVVAEDRKSRIEAILSEIGFSIVHLPKRPIKIDWRKYEFSQLGIDRLALVEGLLYHKKDDVDFYIGVSLGTAITVDIIDRADCYQGGWILSGLKTSLEALHHKTSLLPLLEPSEIGFQSELLGYNTQQAMMKGAIWSLVFTIKGLIEQLSRGFDRQVKCNVVVTGGDAKLISNLIECEYDEALILRGFAAMVRGGF